MGLIPAVPLAEIELYTMLAAMLAAYPDQERLEGCKPGLNVRPAKGERWEAYMVDNHDREVSIGYFPQEMVPDLYGSSLDDLIGTIDDVLESNSQN